MPNDVPSGLGFATQIAGALADGLMLRRARDAAAGNAASAEAWRAYALQLEDKVAELRKIVAEVQNSLQAEAARFDGAMAVYRAVKDEGTACPNHDHHKISRSPKLREDIYETARKVSATDRGVMYGDKRAPKA
jgi:hypothetical protein